ncbi:hypothetical protein GCM10017687_56830 [Streptomyces echinatus]
MLFSVPPDTRALPAGAPFAEWDRKATRKCDIARRTFSATAGRGGRDAVPGAGRPRESPSTSTLAARRRARAVVTATGPVRTLKGLDQLGQWVRAEVNALSVATS